MAASRPMLASCTVAEDIVQSKEIFSKITTGGELSRNVLPRESGEA